MLPQSSELSLMENIISKFIRDIHSISIEAQQMLGEPTGQRPKRE